MSASVFSCRVSAFAIVLINENVAIYCLILRLAVVIARVIADNQQANTVDAVAELIANSCAAIRYTDVCALAHVMCALV